MYPYIKTLNIYNEQIILEICNVDSNYRIILKPEYLFDEDDYMITSQKYVHREGKKICGLHELYKYNIVDFNTNLRLFRIVNT